MNTLFDVSACLNDTEKAREANRRGNYKVKPPKVVSLNPYKKLQMIQEQIANYFEYPLFCISDQDYIDNGIHVWYSVYTGEEPFKVFEAEIVGTENYYITDRIEIHEKLLNMLKDGMSIDRAVNSLGVIWH